VTRPPHLARRFLSVVAPPAHRNAILGDLEEEFALKTAARGMPPIGWYWRQTLSSAPDLLISRLRGKEGAELAFFLLTCLAAIAMTTVWDIAVARKVAQGASQSYSSLPLYAVRAVYLTAQAFGFALTGGLAALSFARRAGRRRSSAWRMAPFALMLFAPALTALAFGQDPYPLSFRLVWIGCCAPAFFLGAHIGAGPMNGRR
jgi:hypothetical protein